ncbi:glycosyltransferase family 2 protein [Litorimonas sp.]|uniref:glycosyltransferase family 2 protein n=1 Tax=Litorimonas sp. TaxID=1892381 RepID=UPI003A8B4EAF
MVKLSVVSSFYQSQDYVENFISRVRKQANQFGGDYEIIIVNDGSTDNTLKKTCELAAEQQDITIINLSRNFGHHKALMKGLAYSRGDFVFVLDSDLEEDPAWLGAFYEKMQKEEADVVCAVQDIRKGKFFERATGAIFYKLFNRASDLKVVPNAMVARLMTRRFVDVLTGYSEQVSFLPGLFAYSGFKQVTLVRKKGDKGKTSYSFRNRVELALGSFIRFSDFPLRAILYSGAIISFSSFFSGVYLALKSVSQGKQADDIYVILTAIGAIGGVILLALGVIGFYLLQVFREVKRRPDVIVESIYKSQTNSDRVN